jgi:hypothetical protein
MTISFDTLRAAERLKAGGLPPEAATAIVEVLSGADTSGLATKQDLADVRAELKADIADLKNATKQDIKDLEIRFLGALRTQTGLLLAAIGLAVALIKLLP